MNRLKGESLQRFFALPCIFLCFLLCSNLQASNIGLFYNMDYVDIEDGNLFAEASNLKSSLEYLGHSVVFFNDFRELIVSDIDVVIIPELEKKSFLDIENKDQIPSLELYVKRGGGLIVMGVVSSTSSNNDNALTLINQLCDSQLVSGPAVLEGTCVKSPNLLPGNFTNAPSEINNNNALVYIRNGYPEGSNIVYYNSLRPSEAAVLQLPLGVGSVLYFGWGWWNAFPTGTQDGGWLDLLDASIETLNCAGPTAAFESTFSFELEEEGTFFLTDNYFLVGVESCAEVVLDLSKYGFNCEDVGKVQLVDVIIKDLLGRELKTSVQIEITDPNEYCTTVTKGYYFVGSVENGAGTAVPNVFLDLEAEQSQLLISDQAGLLGIDEPIFGEYAAYFYKEDDIARQVTTNDLRMLNRHLLGLELFTSPYQYIAADINGDLVLDINDLTIIKKLILSTEIDEQLVPNWQFLHKLYRFNPSVHPLLQNWDNLQGNTIDSDNNEFKVIAIKSGDIDFSY